MAKKRTAADNIRKNVHDRLGAAKLEKVNPIVSELKSLSSPERNNRLLTAATAMYRATTDNTYTPTEKQAKDYAAAVEIIAQKRGITPEKDGKYSEEILNNQLSPLELMNGIASQYLKDEGDNDATRQLIDDGIRNVYGGDADQAAPVLAAVQNAPAYKTDEEFLMLSSQDQQEYLEGLSNFERDRLQNLAAEQHNSDSLKDILKNAGEFEGRMDDPDWGHKKDDDNFKIEQGDIIEYLMKDVILASAAWVGNKTAGLVGIVGYELGSAGVREARPYLRKGWHKVDEGWDKLKSSLFGPDKSDSEADKKLKEEKKKIFNDVNDCYNANIEAYEDAVSVYSREDDKNTAAFKKLQRQLIKHYAVLDDDGITFPVIEDKGMVLPLSKQDYVTFFGAEGAEKGKNSLREIQKNFDAYQIAAMTRTIEESGQTLTDADRMGIKEWFVNYTKAVEDSVRNKDPNAPLPNTPPEYVAAYQKARQAALIKLKLLPETRVFEAQKGLFAEHYSMYKFLELQRTKPDDPILSDKEKYAAFMETSKREADILFLSADQRRRNGENIPSREQLIAKANDLVNASQKAGEERNQNPVADTLSQIINPPTNQNDQQTLLQAAQDINAENFLLSERRNCETRIAELKGAREQNADRRKLLEQTKKRAGLLKTKEQSFSNDPSTRGVALNSVRIKEGGK